MRKIEVLNLPESSKKDNKAKKRTKENEKKQIRIFKTQTAMKLKIQKESDNTEE